MLVSAFCTTVIPLRSGADTLPDHELSHLRLSALTYLFLLPPHQVVAAALLGPLQWKVPLPSLSE